MKSFFFAVIIFCTINSSFSQQLTCKDFQVGIFQFEGINGGYFTVIRNDSTQLEMNTKMAQHSTMKINWDSDCTYTLSNRVEHQWGKKPVKDEEIFELKNIVYKIELPNKFYVKTYLENFPDTLENIFYKIDTAKYYDNIFQLKEYEEYKNSKSYGQTIFGEIYSINYYQSNKIDNKYILIFETIYQTDKLNKSKLLDSKILTIEKGQKITNSNCRYNNEYDDEILVVYTSINENNEANIIQAYRFNKKTQKIEELDKSKVKYKESDRMKIKW